jgi:hypothetical protein
MQVPAHCHDDRPPLLAREEPEPLPEPKPIGIKAVAAASRWHGMTLGELMRLAAEMAAAMTIKS